MVREGVDPLWAAQGGRSDGVGKPLAAPCMADWRGRACVLVHSDVVTGLHTLATFTVLSAESREVQDQGVGRSRVSCGRPSLWTAVILLYTHRAEGKGSPLGPLTGHGFHARGSAFMS